jgi:4-hydroxy-tetrahydrodipicolinate synthase
MFAGSITALVTPFNEADEIDFGALSTLVARQLDGGTAGLVIAGTTGEAPSLRGSEFERLLDNVVGQVAGQVPVIAGTGSASTDRTVEHTRLAAQIGADAVLVVTPYYVRPTQPGLMAHFRAVADASELPVILYNVPSRTSVDMQPETIAELAGHERIVGLKEAVGRMERVDALRALCGASFTLLSGDDSTCLEAMRHGARGVISVASNLVPGPFHQLCAAAARADWTAAGAVETGLRRLFDLLAVETNPIPVKWALQEMSLCSARLRLPLVALSERHRPALRDALESLDLLRP